MPPAMMAKSRQSLSVQIEVFNNVDSHPSRRFTLESPLYQIKVGRGSQSGGKELFPADHNAWFESRVMSRSHAILQADPITEKVYVEDIGSMHGTYVEDRKLVPHTRESLFSGDFLRFGAEVTRGPGTCWINDDEPAPYCCSQPIRWLPLDAKVHLFNLLSESNRLPESFPPLEMCISFNWIDDAPQPPLNETTMPRSEISRNSFSVPEYDDGDDDDDDDEIEIIGESVRTPRVEIVVPSRRYSVPESDLSCAGSFTSDDSSSEPPTPSPRASRTDLATGKQLSETIGEKSPEDVVGSHTRARERLAALADAPSAAELFRCGGEELVVSHQSLSQPRLAAERETLSRTTDSVREDKDALGDEDMTESDAESQDGFSDDLFDDDGENAQQELNMESPQLSEIDDSDEEPRASNRGTKLPENTTYRQVPRPCQGVEKNPTMIPVTEGEPGVLPNICSPLFEIAYSANSTRDQQNLAQEAPSNMNDARAPSPSDAAMAKTTTAQLPPMDHTSPSVVPMTSDFPRISSTEASYARPSWQGWPGYTTDFSSEYAPYMYPTFHSQPAYQEGPFGYRPPGDFINPDTSSNRGEEEATNYQPVTFESPERSLDSAKFSTYPSTTAAAPDTDQSPRVLYRTNLRATRLSIDDIVEKNTQESSTQNDRQKMKRKMDDMSTDEDVLATAPTLSDTQDTSELGLATSVVESTQSATLPAITPPKEEAELVVPTQKIETVEQPPRKRAKTGVAIYAAAVFAGVVAGGVGTMAALLAMPPI